MRLVRETLGAVAATLAEVDGDGEARGPGDDVDRSSSGEVEAAEDEDPAVGVPGPVGDGVVDDGGPDEDEDHERAETTSLCYGANSDDRSGGGRGDKKKRVRLVTGIVGRKGRGRT